MNKRSIHIILTFLISLVWLINGLYCKVLNLAPRHQEIVANILGEKLAPILTLLIGISEIIMAIWILSRFKPKLCAVSQICIVITMNIIELILVQDLLMWGKLNFLFALLFVGVVWLNDFVLVKNKQDN